MVLGFGEAVLEIRGLELFRNAMEKV